MANILKEWLTLQLLTASFVVFFGSGLGWAHSKQEITIPANNAEKKNQYTQIPRACL